jgi:hypothetical protein
LLIISACTAKKKYRLPDQLTAIELDDNQRRRAGENRLHQYQASAPAMYVGNAHLYVCKAILLLRDSGYQVTHIILSAGYGWLNEQDVIVPYNVTFAKHSTAWIKKRGQQLNLRNGLIQSARDYEQVIFLLGKEYLEAIGLPLPIESMPPSLAYIAPSMARKLGNGLTTVQVGKREQAAIGAHWSSAKEKQFLVDIQNTTAAKGVQ